MLEKLAKLNRLRLNAGKTELKSWKSSQEKLDERIADLEASGFKDVVPGADPDAAPKTDDPALLKARPEPKPKPGDLPTKDTEKPTTKVKPGLSRGLHDEKYAVHSRKAVQDHRRDERRGGRGRGEVTLSDAERRAILDEAEHRKSLAKGQVDPKKDPDKAKRQAEKIAAKQEARKAAGKTAKPKTVDKDHITVADIARGLGIEPKIARAKLRRYEDKPEYPKPVKGERWTFPKAAQKAIEKILK